jgi:hypothetical protein
MDSGLTRQRRYAPIATVLTALLLAGPVAGAVQEEGAIQLREVTPGELRSEAFRLDRPATLKIDAVGAESGGLNRVMRARNAVARFVTRVLDKDPPRFDDGWSATAWIVDTDSRAVVWRLDAVDTRAIDNGLRAFEGEIELPAGTYEVYYASFPKQLGWRGPGARWEYDRDAGRKLHLDIEADGARMTRVDAAAVHEAFEARNAIVLGRGGEELHDRIAFDLDRAVDVDVYMVGEASRSRSYDHGWIIDTDSRETVWAFDWVRSQPAGGAARNRVARERLTLPAGRYAAFFSKDRSHGPGSWRSLPPGDPIGWGLSIRPIDVADRSAFRPYAYEPVPVGNAIVSLTRIGDEEAVSEGFTLARDLDVRIFALGEGRDRESGMFDRAWLEDARTHEPVWTMEFAATRHAGGTAKNRVFDGVIQLPAGSYLVHYLTDDSHAYGDWNGEPPIDAEFWGITVLPAQGALDRSMVKPYDEANDPAVIARIVRVADSRQVRRSFKLDRETNVRIYALGEGQSGEMFDFARIVDASGREVWRMRYEDTNDAGGSRKNRRVNRVISLGAGDYEVIYRTDDSHSWGAWNSSAPSDPTSWGVTLRREN